MSEHVSVITGGTDGIGRLVASELARAGHRVVLLARSPEKAERVVSELRRETGHGRVEWVRCDLASLASVRDAAAEVRARHPRIDRLVGVAARYGGAREETVDGHEAHLAVNYLAPYLLTHLLLPAIFAAPRGRIAHVTGETARIACIATDDLSRRRAYCALGAYGQSKLAQILFVRTLAEQLRGTGVGVHAVHPGMAATGHLAGGPRWLDALWRRLPGPAQAARNVARVALDPGLDGASGAYFFARWRFVPPLPAYDRRLARELDHRSRALVGLPPPEGRQHVSTPS